MAHIFVSYTSSDRDWAFWIAKELEALGHTPHLHDWEIMGGDDIYAWMEQRHDSADHVLCVVSDDYQRAPYSTLELNAALWQAANKRPRFVLLVVVKPCKLPTLADHIRRCEIFGIPEEAASVRFRNFMSMPDVPTTAVFPGNVVAVSNVPFRLPIHFMGRDDALDAIDEVLRRGQGRAAITALHGLRGVGKTTLAVAYAERHLNDYRATGGSEHKLAPPCELTLPRWAFNSTGCPAKRKRTRLLQSLLRGCATKATAFCSYLTTH